MESGDTSAYPRRVPSPPKWARRAIDEGEVSAVSDGQQSDEPMRRPRGRHAVSKARTAPGAGWRARIAAALALVVASVEPRISAAGAWLFERRLHVLIIASTVATVALIGGAVTLISIAGAPRPEGEAATLVDSPRPTSTDPASPSSYAPILPSPGPPPSISPTPTPSPDEGPGDGATDAPTDPTSAPAPTEPEPPDSAPGATNKPDKPKESDKPQVCDEQDALLGIHLFGPPCP